ncbi:MAG: polyketide synthase dehydratase domain-containing protein, partial [Acidobacteriota bacterium]
LAQRGVSYQLLNINYAFHSPQMDSLQDELSQALQGIELHPPSIPIYSTLTGQISSANDFNAEYWGRHLREPVLFATVISKLITEGYNVFLEISPSQSLSGAILECLQHHKQPGTLLASLRRTQEDRVVMLKSLGTLYTLGYSVNWRNVYPSGRFVQFPSYPWQRERYWWNDEMEDEITINQGYHSNVIAKHPLLSKCVESRDAAGNYILEIDLHRDLLLYLADHRYQGEIVLLGVVLVEMVLAALKEVFHTERWFLKDIEFLKALTLPETSSRPVQIIFSPFHNEESSFRILSLWESREDRENNLWTLHVSGKACSASTNNIQTIDLNSLEDIRVHYQKELSGEDLHLRLREVGYHFGASFQGIERLWQNNREALAEIQIPSMLESELVTHQLHPAILEPAGQALLAIRLAAVTSGSEKIFVPTKITEIRIHSRPNAKMCSYARLHPSVEVNGNTFDGDVQLFDQSNRLIVEIIGLRFQQLLTHNVLKQQSTPARKHSIEKHPLLGRHLDLAGLSGNRIWETTLNTRVFPYLADHKVQETIVLPAAAYIEIALAIAGKVLGTEPCTIMAIELQKALFLSEHRINTLQITASFNSNRELNFFIHSRSTNIQPGMEPWSLHVKGLLTSNENSCNFDTLNCADFDQIQARCREEISIKDYYIELQKKGNNYGSSFQGIARLYRGNNEALGWIEIPEILKTEARSYHIHPALLDACFQVLAAAAPIEATISFMPVYIDSVRIYRRLDFPLWSYAIFRSSIEQDTGYSQGDIKLFDESGHLVAEIQGLCSQTLNRDIEYVLPQNIDDWFYQLQWQLKSLEASFLKPYQPNNRRKWLIFADNGGIGEAFVRLLMEQDNEYADYILVFQGDEFKQIDQNRCQVSLTQTESIKLLFTNLLSQKLTGFHEIIYLWGLNTPAVEDLTTDSLAASQTLICSTLLCLIQELVSRAWEITPRLSLITQGAQQVNNRSSSLAIMQSTIWGIGRTIALEHPNLSGRLIDLDPEASAQASALMLWEESQGVDREDQIAFRQKQRYVARLIHKPKSTKAELPLQFKPNASYLITGGLGELGLLIADWMVQRGARRLILLARTKLPPRSEWSRLKESDPLARPILAIQQLEASGASVHLASVDVANTEELTAFLRAFRRECWPPICGLVHAAGLIEAASLLETDIDSLMRILRPKVIGGWLLHQLLEDYPLDFFILISSFASLLSSPLLASYAAANTFLDSLAHYRQAKGKPALSINWAFWSGVGMSARYFSTRQLSSQGIGNFTIKQGLDAMEKLLQQDSVQVGVMRINWQKWSKSHSIAAQSPLLSQLINAEVATQTKINSKAEVLSRNILANTPPREREQLLRSYIQSQVARVLMLAEDKFDIEQSLLALGLDSLMAVELKNRFQNDLGVVISVVKFLEGANIVQLVDQIQDQIVTTITTVPDDRVQEVNEIDTISRETARQLLEDLDHLSDAEVDLLIRKVLVKN